MEIYRVDVNNTLRQAGRNWAAVASWLCIGLISWHMGCKNKTSFQSEWQNKNNPLRPGVWAHVRCLPISRQYCCYSFKAEQRFFPAFKNNLGVAKTKYILLQALIYSERATMIPAGSLLKTTQKSSGWPDLCMLSSVQESIDRNAIACML